MTENTQNLNDFKIKLMEIGNVANESNIHKIKLLLKELIKYISVNCCSSKNYDNAYKSSEIVYNYLSNLIPDGNDTALIVIKDSIITELNKIIYDLDDDEKYDVFISHASKDKLQYVNGLRKEIEKLGVKQFYDSDVIKWRGNWKETILDAASKTEFAIIVISNNFFGREWTEKELDLFMHRQNNDKQKIVLPIIYNVSSDDVIARYPFLKDIQYINANSCSKKDIALSFAEQIITRLKRKNKE